MVEVYECCFDMSSTLWKSGSSPRTVHRCRRSSHGRPREHSRLSRSDDVKTRGAVDLPEQRFEPAIVDRWPVRSEPPKARHLSDGPMSFREQLSLNFHDHYRDLAASATRPVGRLHLGRVGSPPGGGVGEFHAAARGHEFPTHRDRSVGASDWRRLARASHGPRYEDAGRAATATAA